MRQAITISVSENMKKELDKAVKSEGISRSELVRQSLRDYLFLRRFRRLRNKTLGRAEERGFYTEEDIFKSIS